MVERAQERARFERWRQKTGKNISHWKNLPDYKDRAPPSDHIRVPDLKQWLIKNQVL